MNKILEQFNKLTNNEQIYLLNILNEGIKSARELYLDNFGEKAFKDLVEIDPSKTKKYLNWVCKQYSNLVDMDRLEGVIKDFHNKVNKGLIKHTDINYYKDIDELEDTIEKSQTKSETEQEKYIKKTEAKVMLDNDDYFIVEPLTWEASKIYGKGTKWCTVSVDSNSHWYNDVVNIKARIFYVRDKRLGIDNPNYKIAIHVPKYIYYDKDDMDYNIIPCTLWDAEDKATESNLEEVSNLFGINIDKISNIKYTDVSTKEGIIEWLDYMEIEKYSYTINDDLIVNVNGSVDLSNKYLDKIPIQFGIVKKTFNCMNNNLTSLKGSPKEVVGAFYCSYNELTSLKYAPKEVGWSFDCNGNHLKSLKYAPNKVGRDFDCNGNHLKSLKYAPNKVGRDFDCEDNNLTSLKYAPNKVGEDFNCGDNNLTSLKYAPNKVGEDFNCSYNPNLTKEYLSNFDFSFVKGRLNTEYNDINDKWNYE